jgi:hypothetical protein
MTPFPRGLRSAGARLRQGRSSAGLTALRRLHLDGACAPAVTWELTRSRTGKISPTKVIMTRLPGQGSEEPAPG